jgi:1,4-dihydroxy-2-naphthoate octaprenyltransferase
MAVWGTSLLIAGFALGIGLVALKGWMVFALGLIGLLLAVAYSMPPLRLADRGLGEIAVGIAFGVLPVMGTAWLQTGAFNFGAFLVSLPVSCWVANILLVNEIPDAVADAAAGRRNWVVRFGTGAAGAVFLALNLGSALSIFGILLRGEWSWWIAAGVLALLALAWRVYRLLSGPLRDLRTAIETNLAIHALGSVWLTGWALAGGLH